ncbi:hypothetical protein METY_4023 [Methylopila sp. Yamaguchi]|nr:hypothetical protein METY_4023 [Methylopila sp. Yamaguchi]
MAPPKLAVVVRMRLTDLVVSRAAVWRAPLRRQGSSKVATRLFRSATSLAMRLSPRLDDA